MQGQAENQRRAATQAEAQRRAVQGQEEAGRRAAQAEAMRRATADRATQAENQRRAVQGQGEAGRRAAQAEAMRRAAADRAAQAENQRRASTDRISQFRPSPDRRNPLTGSRPSFRPTTPPATGTVSPPSAPLTAPQAPAPVANGPAVHPTLRPWTADGRHGRTPAARPGRSAFEPGRVTYPNLVTRPTSRPGSNHPAHRGSRFTPRPLNQAITANGHIAPNNRVAIVNNNRIANVTPNVYVNGNWGNQWTGNRATIWNQNRVVRNRPVVINTNFQRSLNYAYRPASWGGRPWWSSPTYHHWHHGSWNYGWNRSWHHHYHRPSYRPYGYYLPGYYHHDSGLGSAIAWGLAAWSLGSLAFDTGYCSYHNPYPAPPVQTRTTIIHYTQPLSVVASAEVPEPEEAALISEEKSAAAIEQARVEFRNGDYLASLKLTDEAIAYAPGDTTLHEFRALCLFALGRYGDAAGVLNPVLASGPGWDWATMAGFYSDNEVYTGQLRKLEAYVEGKPDSADSRFLLGYHYMVAGFLDEAHAMFDAVTQLQPADTVAAQLRNLAGNSSTNAEGDIPETESPAPTREPVDPAALEGRWQAASADGKPITLALDPAGTFTWNYESAGGGKVLAGDWSVDEEGRLVLAADDVQMVAEIAIEGGTLKFVLAGSPVGDPGLSFSRL